MERRVRRLKWAGFSDRFISSVIKKGFSKERKHMVWGEKDAKKKVIWDFLLSPFFQYSDGVSKSLRSKGSFQK